MHATCVAIGSRAMLLRGPSGAGKSDLALRLILDPPQGATLPAAPQLVADDQVRLENRSGRIFARAPAAIAGRIEVRGVGLIIVPTKDEAEIRLIVDLVASGEVERMPENHTTAEIMGVALPYARIAAYESSAPLKAVLALFSQHVSD